MPKGSPPSLVRISDEDLQRADLESRSSGKSDRSAVSKSKGSAASTTERAAWLYSAPKGGHQPKWKQSSGGGSTSTSSAPSREQQRSAAVVPSERRSESSGAPNKRKGAPTGTIGNYTQGNLEDVMLAKLVDGPVLRDKQNWDKLRSAILGLTAALPAFVTAIEALPQVIEWQDKAMDKRIRHSIQQRESRDAAKAAEGVQRQPKKARAPQPVADRHGNPQTMVRSAAPKDRPSKSTAQNRGGGQSSAGPRRASSLNKRSRDSTDDVPESLAVPARNTRVQVDHPRSTGQSSSSSSSSSSGQPTNVSGAPALVPVIPIQSIGAPQVISGMPQLTFEQQQQMWAFFMSQQQGQPATASQAQGTANPTAADASSISPLPIAVSGGPPTQVAQVAMPGAPPPPPGPPPQGGAPATVSGTPTASSGALTANVGQTAQEAAAADPTASL